MRRTWSNYVIFLMIVALVLAACGQEETPTPTEPADAANANQAEEKATNSEERMEPAGIATAPPAPPETEAPTPTSEPAATAGVVAETSDKCLACHSEKELLINTAAPEEQAPSESSGVG